MQHRHSRPKQIGEFDAIPAGAAYGTAVGVIDPHGRCDESGVRDGAQPRDLSGQLARKPDVVVVAERDDVGVEGQNACVARACQSWRAGVRHYSHGASALVASHRVLEFRSVEDDDDLDASCERLVKNRRNCAPHELWPVVGGHDDTDAHIRVVWQCRLHPVSRLTFLLDLSLLASGGQFSRCSSGEG